MRAQQEVTLQEQHQAQPNEHLGLSLILHRIPEDGEALQDHPAQVGPIPNLSPAQSTECHIQGFSGHSRTLQPLAKPDHPFHEEISPERIPPAAFTLHKFPPSPEPFLIQSHSGSSF